MGATMKVLVISGSYHPIKCGVGDYTKILCEKLAEKIDVSVLTSNKASAENNSNVTILNKIESWKGIKLLHIILREIKRSGYDLVHFQFPTTEYIKNSIAFYIVLPIILRIKRIKVVYTLHEYGDNSWISKLLRKPAIMFSNRVIIVDDKFKSELFKNNKCISKKKVSIIHIGANVPKSTSSSEDIVNLRQHILTKVDSRCNKIIAYFGFINEGKCVDILLEAMACLKHKGLLTSMLLIVGEFNGEKCSAQFYEKLVSIIKQNNLEKFIYVTGYVADKDVGNYLIASDIACLLFKRGVSIRNGSVLAAQQEGIPIITSKPTYDFDMFKSKQFILVDNNVEQVENAILDFQSSTQNREKFNTIDMWEEAVEKHIELYHDLIANEN
jgi:glycosyltransferase involved in cell wall biosynthesis